MLIAAILVDTLAACLPEGTAGIRGRIHEPHNKYWRSAQAVTDLQAPSDCLDLLASQGAPREHRLQSYVRLSRDPTLHLALRGSGSFALHRRLISIQARLGITNQG